MSNKDTEVLQEEIPSNEVIEEPEILSDDLEEDVSDDEKSRYGGRSSSTSNRGRRFRQTIDWDDSIDGPSTRPPPRNRRLPRSAVYVLQSWFITHLSSPYPTDAVRRRLAEEAGITGQQVSNWFINARKRYIPRLAAGGALPGSPLNNRMMMDDPMVKMVEDRSAGLIPASPLMTSDENPQALAIVPSTTEVSTTFPYSSPSMTAAAAPTASSAPSPAAPTTTTASTSTITPTDAAAAVVAAARSIEEQGPTQGMLGSRKYPAMGQASALSLSFGGVDARKLLPKTFRLPGGIFSNTPIDELGPRTSAPSSRRRTSKKGQYGDDDEEEFSAEEQEDFVDDRFLRYGCGKYSVVLPKKGQTPGADCALQMAADRFTKENALSQLTDQQILSLMPLFDSLEATEVSMLCSLPKVEFLSLISSADIPLPAPTHEELESLDFQRLAMKEFLTKGKICATISKQQQTLAAFPYAHSAHAYSEPETTGRLSRYHIALAQQAAKNGMNSAGMHHHPHFAASGFHAMQHHDPSLASHFSLQQQQMRQYKTGIPQDPSSSVLAAAAAAIHPSYFNGPFSPATAPTLEIDLSQPIYAPDSKLDLIECTIDELQQLHIQQVNILTQSHQKAIEGIMALECPSHQKLALEQQSKVFYHRDLALLTRKQQRTTATYHAIQNKKMQQLAQNNPSENKPEDGGDSKTEVSTVAENSGSIDGVKKEEASSSTTVQSEATANALLIEAFIPHPETDGVAAKSIKTDEKTNLPEIRTIVEDNKTQCTSTSVKEDPYVSNAAMNVSSSKNSPVIQPNPVVGVFTPKSNPTQIDSSAIEHLKPLDNLAFTQQSSTSSQNGAAPPAAIRNHIMARAAFLYANGAGASANGGTTTADSPNLEPPAKLQPFFVLKSGNVSANNTTVFCSNAQNAAQKISIEQQKLQYLRNDLDKKRLQQDFGNEVPIKSQLCEDAADVVEESRNGCDVEINDECHKRPASASTDSTKKRATHTSHHEFEEEEEEEEDLAGVTHVRNSELNVHDHDMLSENQISEDNPDGVNQPSIHHPPEDSLDSEGKVTRG